MRVWLLEAGTSWDRMVTTAVLRKKKKGLRALNHLVGEARSETGLAIKVYTYEDGSHAASWSGVRLRLRKASVI